MKAIKICILLLISNAIFLPAYPKEAEKSINPPSVKLLTIDSDYVKTIADNKKSDLLFIMKSILTDLINKITKQDEKLKYGLIVLDIGLEYKQSDDLKSLILLLEEYTKLPKGAVIFSESSKDTIEKACNALDKSFCKSFRFSRSSTIFFNDNVNPDVSKNYNIIIAGEKAGGLFQPEIPHIVYDACRYINHDLTSVEFYEYLQLRKFSITKVIPQKKNSFDAFFVVSIELDEIPSVFPSKKIDSLVSEGFDVLVVGADTPNLDRWIFNRINVPGAFIMASAIKTFFKLTNNCALYQ